jgi:hypothetical protein
VLVCEFCCSRRSSKIDGQAASTCLRRPGMANARIKLQPGFAGRQCVSAPDTLPSGSTGVASGVLHAKREGAMARVCEQVDGTRRATNGDDWVAAAG